MKPFKGTILKLTSIALCCVDYADHYAPVPERFIIGKTLAIITANSITEASKNYSIALQVGEKEMDSLSLAELYVNLGQLEDKLEKYDEALKYDFAALRIYEKEGANFNIPFALNNIAIVYMKQKKYADADKYLTRAFSTAKATNHLEYIKYSYENQAILDSLQGNYKNALKNFKTAISYRNIFFNDPGFFSCDFFQSIS
jgi:tetratricopeptide (TPR) repeat protein